MINFDKEELLKIAELSALKLNDEQLHSFAHDLREILNYTSELEHVEPPQTIDFQLHVNVFREDKIHESDSQRVLAQAPKQKNGYFVVPKIL